MIAGGATSQGTQRYRARFAGCAAVGHFREANGLWLSSLGVGTYLGETDAATDARYADAIERALTLGANALDTAINYRFQRSERSIAVALGRLIGAGKLARDEVVVSTKAGFLTFDADQPRDPRAYLEEHYIRAGIVQPADIVGGMHCMTPRYLEDQLARSRRNLNLECIDIFYLHNPETQLGALPRGEFLQRIRAAFEKLESFVTAGHIRCYGTATWNGYRQPSAARDYLSLEEIVAEARAVAGDAHHFKVVQLPFNLAMPEAFLHANQRVAGETVPFLLAAQRLGLTVVASASLLQGQVAHGMPDELRRGLDPTGALASDAQRALQFVRSTPGIACALVGMSRLEHVEENLRLAAVPPLSQEQFLNLLRE